VRRLRGIPDPECHGIGKPTNPGNGYAARERNSGDRDADTHHSLADSVAASDSLTDGSSVSDRLTGADGISDHHADGDCISDADVECHRTSTHGEPRNRDTCADPYRDIVPDHDAHRHADFGTEPDRSHGAVGDAYVNRRARHADPDTHTHPDTYSDGDRDESADPIAHTNADAVTNGGVW